MKDWKRISCLPSLRILVLVSVYREHGCKVFEYVNKVRSMRYKKAFRKNFGRSETFCYSQLNY